MQDDSQGDLANYILKLRGEASDVQEMAQAAAPEQQAAMMRLATTLDNLADQVERLCAKQTSRKSS